MLCGTLETQCEGNGRHVKRIQDLNRKVFANFQGSILLCAVCVQVCTAAWAKSALRETGLS